MLAIIKFASVMLLSCSINTQPYIYDRSSSSSQFLVGSSRNLQKLLIYLIRRNTLAFKTGTAGCRGCGE